jgi:hypothetical protein
VREGSRDTTPRARVASIASTANSVHYPDTPKPGIIAFKRTEEKLIIRNVDPPLPPEPAIFILPPVQKGMEMLATYFEATPTTNFLHRPSVEAWMNALYTDFYQSREGKDSKAKNAVVLMIFAVAESFVDAARGQNLESRYASLTFIVDILKASPLI